MRLLKIVAVPAAVALLLSPANAADAATRSKILGKIQKAGLAQAQKGKVLAQASEERYIGAEAECYEDCDTGKIKCNVVLDGDDLDQCPNNGHGHDQDHDHDDEDSAPMDELM